MSPNIWVPLALPVLWSGPALAEPVAPGAFSGIDLGGTTTDVHILLNGVSIFDGNVNGFGPNTGPSFSLTRALSVDDTLDFAVGFGANGDFFRDATALAAHIAPTAVPEPASFILLGTGILSVLVDGWRRRRATRA